MGLLAPRRSRGCAFSLYIERADNASSKVCRCAKRDDAAHCMCTRRSIGPCPRALERGLHRRKSCAATDFRFVRQQLARSPGMIRTGILICSASELGSADSGSHMRSALGTRTSRRRLTTHMEFAHVACSFNRRTFFRTKQPRSSDFPRRQKSARFDRAGAFGPMFSENNRING
jgi:hypothetical protein